MELAELVQNLQFQANMKKCLGSQSESFITAKVQIKKYISNV